MEKLENYLKEWQVENQRHESTEFLRGTIYAVDRMLLQIKDSQDANKVKAKKYDELMLTIQEMEFMYATALEKYPSLTEILKEKLNVLKLVKL